MCLEQSRHSSSKTHGNNPWQLDMILVCGTLARAGVSAVPPAPKIPRDTCSTHDREHCGMTSCAWSVQGSPAAFLSILEHLGEADTTRPGACV